jgi:large subunit ribosomal protein L6
MSRIGKLPITIPANVDITWKESDLIITGKFGILQNTIPEILQIDTNNDKLIVSLKDKTRTNNALYGLYRTLISNDCWCF